MHHLRCGLQCQDFFKLNIIFCTFGLIKTYFEKYFSITRSSLYWHFNLGSNFGQTWGFLHAAALIVKHCHWRNDYVNRRHFLDFLQRVFSICDLFSLKMALEIHLQEEIASFFPWAHLWVINLNEAKVSQLPGLCRLVLFLFSYYYFSYWLTKTISRSLCHSCLWVSQWACYSWGKAKLASNSKWLKQN